MNDKAQCPHCEKMIAVSGNGKMWRHRCPNKFFIGPDKEPGEMSFGTLVSYWRTETPGYNWVFPMNTDKFARQQPHAKFKRTRLHSQHTRTEHWKMTALERWALAGFS